MQNEERYIRFFKLNQERKEYILSVSIYENALRLSCQENKAKSGSYYETDFTLDELIKMNRYFTIMSSIYEAQNELIKAIEKQKVGIEIGQNLLNIVFPIEKGIIDINYDDEQIRFSYPMLEPTNIILNKKFIEKGIIILNFVIMIEMGKKYKKIAKGDLKLFYWKQIIIMICQKFLNLLIHQSKKIK